MIHMRKMNAFVTKLVLRCVNINILPLAVVAPTKLEGKSQDHHTRKGGVRTKKSHKCWREMGGEKES